MRASYAVIASLGDTELILDKVVSVFVLGALYGDLGNTQRNTQLRTVGGKASAGCCENVRCRPCHPQRAEIGSRANCSQGRACCGWGWSVGAKTGREAGLWVRLCWCELEYTVTLHSYAI